MNRAGANRLAAVATLLIALFTASCSPTPDSPEATLSTTPASFVGTQRCGQCHAAELRLWQGSHHDLAMQVADDSTVLADFTAAPFAHRGVTSRFDRRPDGFWIETDGPDGQPEDFRIAYTFGVDPLQQYLVEFPGGRLQALPLAWDSRPLPEGGQRWFHLMPDEDIPAGDVLHWTGPNQNWNYMCASCHSTALEKNYDQLTDSYSTHWQELNVGCEACHGAGSHHVEWATASDRVDDPGLGLIPLNQDPRPTWDIDPVTGIAVRSHPPGLRTEIETCSPCHSRRSSLKEPASPGHLLLDSHRPALIEAGLYHADGQILDEVYVYGSFRQSKMYQAGVTCSDCHDPHALQVRGDANQRCAGCHAPERFDTAEHHHHAAGSPGAGCVDCHMPATTYMQVDDRRDHSFRVPRPDLTVGLGVPNACNGCHQDRGAAWADRAARAFWGDETPTEPHYGQVLAAARRSQPGSLSRLLALAGDLDQPAIVRASALQELRSQSAPPPLLALRPLTQDADPLVRAALPSAAERLEPQQRVALLGPLLTDPVLAVRVETARLLSQTPRQDLPVEHHAAFDRALGEFRTSLLADAERPDAQLGLGLLSLQQGDVQAAESAYLKARDLAPWYQPAAINLADLYRSLGRDADGERVLVQALANAPEAADLHHALGLLMVRTGRSREAIRSLQLAAELQPDNARYAYVHAVAVDGTGDRTAAVLLLTAAWQRTPTDLDILAALVAYARESGDSDLALLWGRRLAEVAPPDEGLRQMLVTLEAEAAAHP